MSLPLSNPDISRDAGVPGLPLYKVEPDSASDILRSNP